MGFVASTTSRTSSDARRFISWAMRSSSGPMPSIGERAPPSTWYTPLYTAVRSMGGMSRGSLTTQMMPASRLDDWQISHRSSSA